MLVVLDLIEAWVDAYTSSAYTSDLIQAFHNEEQIVSFLFDASSENTKETIRIEIDKNPMWLIQQNSHLSMCARSTKKLLLAPCLIERRFSRILF